MSATARKERKTYTLDRDLALYVEAVKRELRKASASSALEEILRERKRQKELETIEAAVSSYYDSLSEDTREENRAWGAFGESQIERE